MEIINEYLVFESYFPKCFLPFHQPNTEYMASSLY